MIDIIIKVAPIVIIAIIVVAILAFGYVRCPPDLAFIISGPKTKPRILIGKAGLKIPFFERLDKLLIRQISIDIKTGGYVPTLDFIGVDIDAIAKVRIMTSEEGLPNAMRNFLNMNENEIIATLTDSLQGNMREIIGTVSLKDLCTDRKKFGDQIQEKAQGDMAAKGTRPSPRPGPIAMQRSRGPRRPARPTTPRSPPTPRSPRNRPNWPSSSPS